MKSIKQKHHRRSIRLKGYDYSQSGAYFITICTQNKKYLFGKIADNEMQLNDAGEIIDKWWLELKNKFNNIELDEYVIMPNHFHGIICINTMQSNNIGDIIQQGEHIGSPLHKMIQWFKTMTTNEYIRGVKSDKFPSFEKSLWQRNYYEHIIRAENELYTISQYIYNNPYNWRTDELFSE
jgi:REP element-mobilizing transposase RayT